MLKLCVMLCLLLVCTFGCKQKEKEESKKEIEVFSIKDLNYHLSKELEEIDNSIGVEQKLTDDVYLRSFAFFEKGENHYDLILELQDDITDDVISKYTFAVEGVVEGEELKKLSDYAISKNRDYEAWYATPKVIKANKFKYVIIDIKTKLRHFDILKFYLFDKEGYKGDIGERVLFYDYRVN